MSEPGVYGKLPAHGDFIQRNLSPAFVRQWDVWLQHFVAGAKDKMGADWLDIYLTSPMWRFALSHGVVDDSRWAGILMPSVDQVGRYFPFTIAARLPDNLNPMEFMSSQTTWYTAVEELGLLALNDEIALDDLVQELAEVKFPIDSVYAPSGKLRDSYAMQIDMEFEEQSAGSAYPYILDSLLVKLLSSYSVWSTAGSERVAPCVFNVQGLPAVSKLPAMLDGQWQEWGWTQPFTLQSQPES